MTAPWDAEAAAREFSAWCRSVLDAEGMADWKIEPGEAYCEIGNRTIRFDPRSTDHANFLHEVAHAAHPEPEGEHRNHYHGGGWFGEFQRLVNKWMMVRATAPSGAEAMREAAAKVCEVEAAKWELKIETSPEPPEAKTNLMWAHMANEASDCAELIRALPLPASLPPAPDGETSRG